MKKLSAILFLSIVTMALGQQKNTVFVEFGSNGGVFSRNFERQLTKNPGLSVRLGLGFSFFEPQHADCNPESPYCNFLSIADYDLSIPFSIQYLINLGGANYLETGLGYTFQFQSSQYDEDNTNVYFTSLGFRSHFGQGRGWVKSKFHSSHWHSRRQKEGV